MRSTSRYGSSPRRRSFIPRAIRRNPFTTLVWGLVAVIILGAVSFGGYRIFTTLAVKDTVTCTVESKERSVEVVDGQSQTRKLIYSENCGILTVDDSIFFGKFNSADTYQSIKEGETYVFDIVGIRNGFFSMFPNIIEVKEVTQ